MMNVQRVKLWSIDGTACPGSETIVATLESQCSPAIRRIPVETINYVHASGKPRAPEKALAGGWALEGRGPCRRAPGGNVAGDIMQRVGSFYEEAAEANREASAAR